MPRLTDADRLSLSRCRKLCREIRQLCPERAAVAWVVAPVMAAIVHSIDNEIGTEEAVARDLDTEGLDALPPRAFASVNPDVPWPGDCGTEDAPAPVAVNHHEGEC